MAEAFVKLYKKMLAWEWYDDINTKVLFLHCLLKANWKPTRWHGVELEPGQFVTSLPTLAEETQLSVRQVRVALDHLNMTGEVTSKCQSKYRIITVNSWSEYQSSDRQDDRQMTGKRQDSDRQMTGKRQANDRQMTADKEYIDIKEYKEKKEVEEVKEVKEEKHIYGEYGHVRISDSERDRLFNDYGEEETMEAIKYLDEYIEMKGYKAKNHYLCMRKWVFDAIKRDKPNKPNKPESIFDAIMNA